MICMRRSHCNLVVLIRNRTIRASVVVLKAPSCLSGFLGYRGFKSARAQQAPPLWAGLRRTDLGAVSFRCSKSTLSSELQPAA